MLKDIGEFGLIELLKQNTINDPKNVVIGIGDDAAVLIPEKDKLQLVSTDMLIEGVHFDLSFITPFELGYKALAVNLSDIAAMGGYPKQVVVAVAIPKQLSAEWLVELYRGMKSIAKDFSVNIVGGDTVSSQNDLVINVTAIGEVAETNLQRRSTAEIGDLVVVTGFLGDSAAGLSCLQQGISDKVFAKPLIKAHHLPLPQVDIAKIIAPLATAMNDISDGLASEANEIAAASGVNILLNEASLPLSSQLVAAANCLAVDPLEWALYGGEDYQLVFTIKKAQYDKIQQEQLLHKLTVVGRVTETGKGVSLLNKTGKIVKIAAKGYNHFI